MSTININWLAWSIHQRCAGNPLKNPNSIGVKTDEYMAHNKITYTQIWYFLHKLKYNFLQHSNTIFKNFFSAHLTHISFYNIYGCAYQGRLTTHLLCISMHARCSFGWQNTHTQMYIYSLDVLILDSIDGLFHSYTHVTHCYAQILACVFCHHLEWACIGVHHIRSVGHSIHKLYVRCIGMHMRYDGLFCAMYLCYAHMTLSVLLLTQKGHQTCNLVYTV